MASLSRLGGGTGGGMAALLSGITNNKVTLSKKETKDSAITKLKEIYKDEIAVIEGRLNECKVEISLLENIEKYNNLINNASR